MPIPITGPTYHSSSRDEDVEVSNMESHHLFNAYLNCVRDLVFNKIEAEEKDPFKAVDMKLDRILTNEPPDFEDEDKVNLLVKKQILKVELKKRNLWYLIS